MVAERTCKSIWLIIFTLPAEAGLSWGYLHLSHLSFFVQFNSSSYYPTNHLFPLLRMYPSGQARTVHALPGIASWHSVPLPLCLTVVFLQNVPQRRRETMRHKCFFPNILIKPTLLSISNRSINTLCIHTLLQTRIKMSLGTVLLFNKNLNSMLVI